MSSKGADRYPDAAHAVHLGNLLRRQGRLDEAIEAYREAVAREPANVDARHLLGSVLGRHGLREESRAHYLEALRLAPGDPVVHSSLLYLDGYDPELAPAVALRDHVWWDRLHGRGLSPTPAHENERSAERRLRVGYVSPDFRVPPSRGSSCRSTRRTIARASRSGATRGWVHSTPSASG